MNLPYITDSLPGIGGKLRATPEHFVVEELPLYPTSGEGQHLFVNVTKVDLTTKDVQRALARAFGVHERDVGFAGLKDKHARTTQTFSVNVQHAGEMELTRRLQRFGDALPVTVNWSRRHENKLRTGHLLGNRFSITITELTQELQTVVTRAEAVAAAIRRDGVPNFFGPQRFGHDGANVARGLAVLQGRQHLKDRWLRRFLVSAYQSYLCNQYLARRLDSNLFARVLPGDVAKKYDTGGLFDVENAAVEQLRYEAHEISFTAPVFGAKMRPAHGAAALLETEVLAEASVDLEHFARAKADGTRRLGRLLVDDLTVKASTHEEEPALVAEFTLPKGAFATTVLRELMKVELANAPEEDE